MKAKTKTKWVPMWCQCHDCLETFSLDALVKGTHIIKLEHHPRVARSKNNGDYYHRCGGNGATGRLKLYPTLKYWST
jgi:hypothetical protein